MTNFDLFRVSNKVGPFEDTSILSLPNNDLKISAALSPFPNKFCLPQSLNLNFIFFFYIII